jgi:hypothetical protein
MFANPMPYVLSAGLTLVFYLLSLPYREYIRPRLHWLLAEPVSYALVLMAYGCVLAGKGTILATMRISQDEIVCAKLGCGRLSDWLPIFMAVVVCAVFELAIRSESGAPK